MFWEYMLRGLCHGGYVIGLLMSLGLAAGLVALFCLFLGSIANNEENETRRRP